MYYVCVCVRSVLIYTQVNSALIEKIRERERDKCIDQINEISVLNLSHGDLLRYISYVVEKMKKVFYVVVKIDTHPC